MKILLYIIAFGLMFWALIEQTKAQPNIYIQIVAVAVFFFLMRNLMSKIPDADKQNSDINNEQGN
ncbi:hypothetical protein NU10_06935 [Flavobacterium dauae]|uniref:hypothetical protein n=1 Tax=Flavobacterium dauae TaxID=1563479 RepID=UPI00101B43B6|nr:hypothetical protein [Flavobacterium dauae]WLD25096.1 hypothetical protein NU10_06935 [Flavobacterium dauae]